MKFFHLSDLHIGKQLHHYNMIAEQRDILGKIVALAEREKPDAVLIAGDIYDTPVPSAEAVSVFDEFLTALNDLEPEVTVCIIAGNHDSAKRIDFASDILAKHRVMIAGMPPVTREETIRKVSFFDAYGEVCIYLLPFVKPSYVRNLIDGDITTYDEAVRLVIERENIDTAKRNILVSHQFYTAAGREPETSDSEIRMVGGIENVDTAVLEPFDYAALGHIHRPQCVGRESIRYSGSPLKYSFSEINHTKSVTIADVGDNDIRIKTVPLKPFHDMVHLKGEFKELMTPGSHIFNTDDYIYVTLTDEQDIPDAIGRLRILYPNIMKLDYDNTRTRKYNDSFEDDIEQRQEKQPIELFEELYELQNNQQMDNEQREYINHIIEEIWV